MSPFNICSLQPWFRAHLSAGSTNVGEQLPTGQLSVVPWRRTGVKYTNNEAYFDVVEEIDVIIDKSGTAVSVKRHSQCKTRVGSMICISHPLDFILV